MKYRYIRAPYGHSVHLDIKAMVLSEKECDSIDQNQFKASTK